LAGLSERKRLQNKMDAINLTNLTFISEEMRALISQVNTLATLFKALGGVFILWIVLYFLNRRVARKQRRIIEEIRKDVKRLAREIKKSKTV